jgi:hypothetical protein
MNAKARRSIATAEAQTERRLGALRDMPHVSRVWIDSRASNAM